MATVLSNGQVKLDNGQVVTAQQGGWYDGKQYWDGSLSGKGVIHEKSDQQGAGKKVSKEVVDQSGKDNWEYLHGKGSSSSGSGSGSGSGSASGASVPKLPTIDVEGIYNSAFKTPEIDQATASFTAKQEEINTRRKELADAEAQISDNPFYAEATRVGKINKLREKSDADIQNLAREAQLIQNNLIEMKAEAERQVNIKLKQYDINRQEYQDSLTRLNMLISSGALSNASTQDLANLSVQTGISMDMMSGIVSQAQRNGKEPYITTATDGAGNVTVIAIDKYTGEIMSQNTIAGVAKGSGGGGDSKIGSTGFIAEQKAALNQGLALKKNSYGHIAPNVWDEALTAYLNDALGSRSDFIKEYAAYTDPNRGDFDKAYGFSKNLRSELIGS